MKKIIITTLLFLCINSPVFAEGNREVPILVYHSIAEYPGHGLKGLYVSPKNFEEQIQYLKDHGYTLLTFERWGELDKVKKPIFLTFDDGYKNNENINTIFLRLKDTNFHPTATLFVISDFIGRPNRLTVNDLQRLSRTGFFSIQSHTATHPDLTKIENVQHELEGSKKKIETIIGKPVIALSYPFGSFNHQVILETKKYYLFGLTTFPEVFSEKDAENKNYHLPRKYVYYSTSISEFKDLVKVRN
ncbi:MAG: polysaccharide deacetylase family protein [Bacillota bacterium]|nr:polysaccharide deacetylase family protein [Bacillota bacterium]